MAVATLMVVAAFALVVDSDVDATGTPAGNFQVSFMGHGDSSFASKTVSAYDGYQAVTAADADLGFTANASAANALWYVVYYEGTAYEYRDCNIDYGTLSSIDEADADGTSTNYPISDYHIYAYGAKTTTDGISTEWFEIIPAIGWMHPYSDYSAYYTDPNSNGAVTYSLAVSNIAISHGIATPEQLNGIATIGNTPVSKYNGAYQYSFKISGTGLKSFSDVSVTMKDEEGFYDDVIEGGTSIAETTIYGWGSNAYEALKDALGISNVNGQSEYAKVHENSDGSMYYTYYSWIQDILGSGTESSSTGTSTTYKYWASYTSPSCTSDSYCLYTFGYYSGITGAPNSVSDFGLRYEVSTY